VNLGVLDFDLLWSPVFASIVPNLTTGYDKSWLDNMASDLASPILQLLCKLLLAHSSFVSHWVRLICFLLNGMSVIQSFKILCGSK
jgi:hypothetical protein